MATDQICTSTAKQTTSRNGTSWAYTPGILNSQNIYLTADQGRYYAYDTAQRVGYMEFDFGLDLSYTDISKIELESYMSGGLGNWAEKTIGFYKWEGNIHPSNYTDNNLLGTLKDNGMHSSNPRTFVFDSETNSDLFFALREYFQEGNNVLIICRPDDVSTQYNDFSDNYVRFARTTIKITYQHTTAVGVSFRVNGKNVSSIKNIATCTFEIDGKPVESNISYSTTHTAIPGTPYKITITPESNWWTSYSKIEGTFQESRFPELSGLRWYVDLKEMYQITYNNGGGGNAPESQSKIYDSPMSVHPSMSRPDVLSSYTVTLNCQNGAEDIELTADRTTSYRFKWWRSSSDNKTYGLNADLEYKLNAPTTMTAEWEEITVTSPVELPQVTKPGYSFIGWSTSPEAVTGITGNYTPDRDDITLYAVWAPEGLVMIDDGTQFNPHTIWIDNGTSWDQYMAYIDTGTDWILCNE